MDSQRIYSTQIKAIGYDEEMHLLEISFYRNGVFHYWGVPAWVYREFLSRVGKGRYYEREIRGKYRCTKVR
ncbi:KTSC domain-containing protein [Serratia marcescens]|nr:KTSC domain-containing protein [Serratia marcescens]MBH2766648.1 KTSC domain-containing protein [Serratia marcescens]MBH2766708.1 KTSC domain-containing protein [Serratia marcescens]